MKKVLILISGSTFLFQTSLAMAMPLAPAKTKSFTQWCQQKNTVPTATKRTIDLLLQKAGTKNCLGADSKLRSLTELDLYRNKITDIQPLAALINLTNLELGDNQIKDLKPLTSLSKLSFLGLGSNKISDVKPLASLNTLTGLYLGDNQIKNVKPLASLTRLTELNLDRNQIRNIKPLASLRKLTSLRLYSNQISERVCPIQPDSICKF